MVIKVVLTNLGEVKLPTKMVQHHSLDDMVETLHREHFDSNDRRVTVRVKGNRQDFALRFPYDSFQSYFELGILPNAEDACRIIKQCGKEAGWRINHDSLIE
ncbi:MAG: hypothetical protein NTW50_03475 [Candidatus Berkelbacteria bacterium]|nr:hypothetical protein [Candidatus Berkelbacteria bacterium]